MGIGSADIIVVLIAGAGQLLKGRKDGVVGSAILMGFAHPIVDHFSSVQADDHVAHLAIGKLNDFIGKKQTVGCKGKAEFFSAAFFPGTAVSHELFDHVKIQQRFPSEKVNLQIFSGTGVFDQPVQSLLPRFIAHKGLLSMVFAFSIETIAAGHIAGVGHMKAQSLDDRLALLEQIGLSGKHIFCKQFLFLS